MPDWHLVPTQVVYATLGQPLADGSVPMQPHAGPAQPLPATQAKRSRSNRRASTATPAAAAATDQSANRLPPAGSAGPSFSDHPSATDPLSSSSYAASAAAAAAAPASASAAARPAAGLGAGGHPPLPSFAQTSLEPDLLQNANSLNGTPRKRRKAAAPRRRDMDPRAKELIETLASTINQTLQHDVSRWVVALTGHFQAREPILEQIVAAFSWIFTFFSCPAFLSQHMEASAAIDPLLQNFLTDAEIERFILDGKYA